MQQSLYSPCNDRYVHAQYTNHHYRFSNFLKTGNLIWLNYYPSYQDVALKNSHKGLKVASEEEPVINILIDAENSVSNLVKT